MVNHSGFFICADFHAGVLAVLKVRSTYGFDTPERKGRNLLTGPYKGYIRWLALGNSDYSIISRLTNTVGTGPPHPMRPPSARVEGLISEYPRIG